MTTGHSLTQLIKQIARKRKGSKARKRKMIQRDNFMREQLNKINFNDIRQVNLEQVKDLRKGKRTSAAMSHWTYALINDKMQALSEDKGFVLQMMPSAFKSQRCSGCGLVRKSNRKGTSYICANCGTDINADLNSAINQTIDLPKLNHDFCRTMGVGDFYWTESGIFDLGGVELQSHFPRIK